MGESPAKHMKTHQNTMGESPCQDFAMITMLKTSCPRGRFILTHAQLFQRTHDWRVHQYYSGCTSICHGIKTREHLFGYAKSDESTSSVTQSKKRLVWPCKTRSKHQFNHTITSTPVWPCEKSTKHQFGQAFASTQVQLCKIT